jgi:hypothetical protein
MKRHKMSIYDIDAMKMENATASLENESKGLTLILKGDIDMRDTSIEFLPYLMKVHDAVIRNGISGIRLDLSGLTFMNSNGIKSLINWVMKASEMPPDKRYKISIIANSNIAWQESTLPVLQKLFPDFIIIEQL